MRRGAENKTSREIVLLVKSYRVKIFIVTSAMYLHK